MGNRHVEQRWTSAEKSQVTLKGRQQIKGKIEK